MKVGIGIGIDDEKCEILLDNSSDMDIWSCYGS